MAKYKKEDAIEVASAISEEDTFKKRYGDLQRHLQSTVNLKDEEIQNLKKSLEKATQKEVSFPKTDEEIEEWSKKYPDVSKIVNTIAAKKAQEEKQNAIKEIGGDISDLRKMKQQLDREKAEHHLLQLHPDFESIRKDKSFHSWVSQQPKYLQDALYKNENDALAAARAIDLYKADMGMVQTKRTSSQLKKDAAKLTPQIGSAPTTRATGAFSESQIANMSSAEYEKNESKIMQSIQNNSFVYDVSGAAR